MYVASDLKEKAGLVYNVVESVILAMSVGLMIWMCNVVITHGNVLATQGTKIEVNTDRLTRIETQGSSGLMSHVKDDDTRVQAIDRRLEKLESAVIALQTAPGELKAINARLDGIRDGQSRMEKMLDEHLKAGGK
jgi:hypothetical protein